MEARRRRLHGIVLCLLLLSLRGGYALDDVLRPSPTNELWLYAGRYVLTRTADGAILVELSEGVELVYQGRRLLTQSLTLDTERKAARSETSFTLTAPEGFLRGVQLDYDYERNHGRFRNFEAHVLKVIIRGQMLEGSLHEFSASGITATTCERSRPDYLIEAERVHLTEGARLRLRNARLKIGGRTVLRLPYMTVRVRETAQLLELPSPVYRQPEGWGLRSQVELPLGSRTVAVLSGTAYLNAVPETRVVFATALTAGIPQTSEPELRARFEASALYNLRIGLEQEVARLSNQTLTLRVEQSTHYHPLLAPTRDTRLSRSEIAIDVPYRWGSGLGVLTARIGSQAERVGSVHTPRKRRASIEGEWYQPLLSQDAWNLWLNVWGSYAVYGARQHCGWVRPALSVRWRPTPSLAWTISYGRSAISGTTPFRTDQLDARDEITTRFEGVRGNLRGGFLLRWDMHARELRDVQIQLGWRIHCVEPTVFWRRSPAILLLGVNLTAFL